MTIYDRARDALKHSTPGPWESDGTCVHDGGHDLLEDVGSPLYASTPNLTLAALAPELAAALARVEEVAGELEKSADDMSKLLQGRSWAGSATLRAQSRAKADAAAAIREVLEENG